MTKNYQFDEHFRGSEEFKTHFGIFLVENLNLICNFENFWSPFLAEIDKLMHRVDEIYVRIDSAFKSLQTEEKDK